MYFVWVQIQFIMNKLQQKSHPYLMFKSLNIVRIFPSANKLIFLPYISYFFQTPKNLIFSLTTIVETCQKLLIVSHLSQFLMFLQGELELKELWYERNSNSNVLSHREGTFTTTFTVAHSTQRPFIKDNYKEDKGSWLMRSSSLNKHLA